MVKISIVSALWHHGGWINEKYFIKMAPLIIDTVASAFLDRNVRTCYPADLESLLGFFRNCYQEIGIDEPYSHDVMVSVEVDRPSKIRCGRHRAARIARGLAWAFCEALEYDEKGRKVGNLSDRNFTISVTLVGVRNGFAFSAF